MSFRWRVRELHAGRRQSWGLFIEECPDRGTPLGERSNLGACGVHALGLCALPLLNPAKAIPAQE